MAYTSTAVLPRKPRSGLDLNAASSEAVRGCRFLATATDTGARVGPTVVLAAVLPVGFCAWVLFVAVLPPLDSPVAVVSSVGIWLPVDVPVIPVLPVGLLDTGGVSLGLQAASGSSSAPQSSIAAHLVLFMESFFIEPLPPAFHFRPARAVKQRVSGFPPDNAETRAVFFTF